MTEFARFLRSYGRIQGRPFTEAQAELFREMAPLTSPPAHIPAFFFETEGTEGEKQALADLCPTEDPAAWFPVRPAKVSLEIGFGDGEHLAALAASCPDEGFVGAEPFRNGVAALFRRMRQDSLQNIRVHNGDVRFLLAAVRPKVFDTVYILFPDPWPKKKQKKRRLVSHALLDTLTPKIKLEGQLVIGTDHPDYAEHIVSVLSERAELSPVEEQGFTEAFTTKYRRKGVEEGRPPVFFRRRVRTGA